MSKLTTIENRIVNNKELLLSQLEKLPIIQIACEKTGIGRATYYRWRKEDSEFLSNSDIAISNGIERINDMTESQLLSKIKDGHFPAIAFWLKHRHSAYSTKVELSGSIVTSGELTEEQKKLLDKAVKFVFKRDGE